MDNTGPINTDNQIQDVSTKMTITKKDNSVIELDNAEYDTNKKEVRGTGPLTLKFGDLKSIVQDGKELEIPKTKFFYFFGGKSKAKSNKKKAKGKKTRKSKK